MKRECINKGSLYNAALCVLGLLMLYLNYCTPFDEDDFLYGFMFLKEGGVDFSRPVTDFNTLFVSQFNHWFSMNGRIPLQALAQIFTGRIGKPLFNVVNAIMFCLLIHLILGLSNARKWQCVIVCFFILLIGGNSFGEDFLWLNGSVNYLWAAVFNLVFLRCWIDRRTYARSVPSLLFLFSCVIGWMHEEWTFGIGVMMFFSIIKDLRCKIYNKESLLLFLGYFIGGCLCVFSPGTLHRTESVSLGSSLTNNVLSGIQETFQMQILWIFAAFMLILYFKNRRNVSDSLAYTYIIPICSQLLFFIILGNNLADRGRLCVIILFSILIFSNYKYICESLKKGVLIVASLSIAIISVFIVLYSSVNKANSDAFFQKVAMSDGLVFYDMPKYSEFERCYLGGLIQFGTHSNMSCWNGKVAGAYGKEKLVVLPAHYEQDIFIKDCLDKEFLVISDNLYYKEGDAVFIGRYTENGGSATYYLSPKDPSTMSIKEKLQNYYSQRYKEISFTLDGVVETIEFPSGKFIVVDRNRYYDDRYLRVSL